MAKKKTDTKRSIESYEHRDKERVNNPPVGLVRTARTKTSPASRSRSAPSATPSKVAVDLIKAGKEYGAKRMKITMDE